MRSEAEVIADCGEIGVAHHRRETGRPQAPDGRHAITDAPTDTHPHSCVRLHRTFAVPHRVERLLVMRGEKRAHARGDDRPGGVRGFGAAQPSHDGVERSVDGARPPGPRRREHTCGVLRLAGDDSPWAWWPGDLGDAPGAAREQASDARLHEHRVRRRVPLLGRFVEDARVAGHDPGRHRIVLRFRIRRVRHDGPALPPRLVGHRRDRVLIPAVVDDDVRAFRGDRVDSLPRGAGRNVDGRAQPVLARDARDGSAVVARGGARDAAAGAQPALLDETMDGVGDADRLERRQPESVRFVFQEQLADADLARNIRKLAQRRRPQIRTAREEATDAGYFICGKRRG